MTRPGKNRRTVVRFALYIDRMGAVPAGYQGQSLAEYALQLQLQYQALRQELGPEAAAGARTVGRELIRTGGFTEVETTLETAGLLKLGLRQADVGPHVIASANPRVVATERERLSRKAVSDCRRKLRHLDYMSALLHASRLGHLDLNIYPCNECHGLHVGHRQDAEARRRRSIVRELELLDRGLRELKRDYSRLRDRRYKLALELDALERTDIEPTDLP